MKEIINFNSKFESLEKINPLISKYRINICYPDKPANKYVFSKSVIEKMSNTIRGAGVYVYYFEKEKQLGGHSDDVVKTSNGYKRTGEPVAYGFSDPYKEPYWMEIDGQEWYCADVYLWTGRNPEIEEVMANPVLQSMEVAVDNEEDENGNKPVTDALFLGFCLLQGIDPAFDNSRIQKFSLPIDDKEISKLKEEFTSFADENSAVSNIENSEKEGEKVIKEACEKFSLNSNQIHEILNNALADCKYGEHEWRKYWVNCFDGEFAYVEDCETDKTYRMLYDIVDNVAIVNIESAEEVIRGGFIPVAQKIEDQTEDMSSNANVDGLALQALNEKAAEDNKKLAEENTNLKENMSTLEQQIEKMKADIEAFTTENTKLKEFKASIEKQNKEFEVETTLKEVFDVLPKEEVEVCRMSAENFSLEDISIWKNEVQAKAFKFSKGITEKKSHLTMGLPNNDKPKARTGLWAD